MIRLILVRLSLSLGLLACHGSQATDSKVNDYPAVWFAPINDPNKPDWEILPQERQAGEVILSKLNELGILSNFAATPFELYGKRYGKVEGFWQMMLYPEGPDDERAKDKRVTWKFTREQVAQKTSFEAKSTGTLAEENMKNLGLEEGVSTRLLICAAQMIAQGISPIDAAEVAICSPITDDRQLQRSIREIVTTII